MHTDVKGPGKARGASLVESLLAVVVLGLATLAALALFTQAGRTSRAALLQQQAVEALADLGEQLRADAHADVAAWQAAVAAQPSHQALVSKANANSLDLWTQNLQWPDPVDGRTLALGATIARLPAAAVP